MNRPPTVTLEPGEQMGIFFLNDWVNDPNRTVADNPAVDQIQGPGSTAATTLQGARNAASTAISAVSGAASQDFEEAAARALQSQVAVPSQQIPAFVPTKPNFK